MQGQKQILVVDDNIERRQGLETVLAFVGEHFHSGNFADAEQLIKRNENLLTVILPDNTKENGGSQACGELVKKHPKIPFLVNDVVDAAYFDDFANVVGQFNVPINYGQLTQLIHHCHQYHNKMPKRHPVKRSDTLFRSLIGTSEAMQEVRLLIEQVAPSTANVLILGESGTGKEVVARNIHNHSARKDGPFVPVNCGAIPGELLESELFGHEKGAFTGAISARKGRFELAQGGTLFLDEIGDMPQPMQVKLLRVLQERTFERVGGNKAIVADVRVIAATHQHLEKMIEAGDFREDLFYRLNVFPIETPPLRERKDDVPLLLQELVSRFESESGQTLRFTEDALASLMEHPWSGNVRELSNLVERLLIMYADQVVSVNDLPQKYRHIEADSFVPQYPEEVLERDAINDLFSGFSEELSEDDEAWPHDSEAQQEAESSNFGQLPDEGINLKEYLAELEISLILQALEKHDWVVARSAETLGMRRTTLVEKMRKYNLQKES
jgi:sigma-54 specific flagellar transcriptional regulator A